ncbi:MAG: hypothetical protein F7C36_01490 [Desulfurococcales archaeon]|nr:hypothetical protein [Desulfurococcales archaeon]
MHNILNEHYEVKLPDHYTFSKIEKLIIDKWRNNSKTYLPKYDYRISYLATPQTSFNWALYNAWLELFNCSYLLSFNITPTEARIGINETLKELRKPENILLLIMLEEYLSQDIRDLQIQSTEMGSMSSMWKKCTSSTMYKDINFSDFSYILYYAWLENSHIYEILASNSDK